MARGLGWVAAWGVGLAVLALAPPGVRAEAGAPEVVPEGVAPDASVHATGPENAITFEPLAVVFARTIAVEYERGFGLVGVHGGLALALGDFATGGESGSSGTFRGVSVTIGARFYPWSRAPSGAFVGPFGSVAWVSAESADATADGFGWSVGALAGWTLILGRSFDLSLGAGAGWYEATAQRSAVGELAGESAARSGLQPTLRLAIGAAF